MIPSKNEDAYASPQVGAFSFFSLPTFTFSWDKFQTVWLPPPVFSPAIRPLPEISTHRLALVKAIQAYKNTPIAPLYPRSSIVIMPVGDGPAARVLPQTNNTCYHSQSEAV